MDYFPDLMDPMEERDAFDLANEAWMYDEMTNEIRKINNPIEELLIGSLVFTNPAY